MRFLLNRISKFCRNWKSKIALIAINRKVWSHCVTQSRKGKISLRVVLPRGAGRQPGLGMVISVAVGVVQISQNYALYSRESAFHSGVGHTFPEKNCSCTFEEFLVVLSPRIFLLPLDNLFFPPPPPLPWGGEGGSLIATLAGTNRAREIWLGNPFDFHGAAEPLCEVLVSRFPKNMSLIWR